MILESAEEYTLVAQADVPTRDQVAIEDTWDLSTIYPSDAAWEADAERIPKLLEAAVAHRGALRESASRLAQALADVMAASRTVEQVRTYASLRRDEDTTNQEATARYERAVALAIRAAEALSFLQPEILAIPEERLAMFIADPALAGYGHLLDDVQRRRPYVRSHEIEEILAQAAEVARAPSEAFSALDNADLSFGTVLDDDGNDVTLTKARHNLLLESKNREVRRAAHEALSRAYLDHQHTLAALHSASVRKDVFSARVRGYDSARQQALFEERIPESVYDSLIEAVRAAAPTMERFLALRKQALGLDRVALYDLRVPLAPTPPRHYDYREAVEVVLDGLSVLGEQYVADLRAGFNARWVDVHETKGKRSGAYSWGTYNAPPVMLMNWNGTLSDLFTLAHEAGHAMHSFYSNATQPYHHARYPIFLAEIASTVNETLLTWRLLDETPADDLLTRFSLLNRFADDFYGTVVAQTMYAEFEHRTHAMAEAGEPLTLAALNELCGDLQTAYTPGLLVDDAVRIRWGRVPHFYFSFYVYKYATGLSAAVTLARAIREEGGTAQDRYLDLLAAGGSDYPLTLLRRTGIDLTSPEPVRVALAEFDRVVAEMERLVESGVLRSTGTPQP